MLDATTAGAEGDWTGGRVVEGSGLENRQACKRLVGSNPTPSAIAANRRLSPWATHVEYAVLDLTDGGEREFPTPDAINDYLASSARQPRQRLVKATIGGGTVWIKRYDVERQPIGRFLHAAISPMLPSPVLKASRLASPTELAKREERKAHAFAAAGFCAPSVLLRDGALLVLSDEGTSLENKLSDLRENDPVYHDALLCQIADMFGKIHTAGLCHGRPHPRDVSVNGDRWCLLDFEEEPEAVMQLSAAQARDAWLLFFQITHSAIAPNTSAQAFAAYRAAAPTAIMEDLNALVGRFARLLPLLRVILRVRPGGDLGRLKNATELMVQELGESRSNVKSPG